MRRDVLACSPGARVSAREGGVSGCEGGVGGGHEGALCRRATCALAALPASEPFCFHTTSLLPARSSSAYAAFSRARLRDAVVVIVFVHFSFAGFNSARFCSSFLSFSRRFSSFSWAFACLLKLRAIASLTFLSIDMAVTSAALSLGGRPRFPSRTPRVHGILPLVGRLSPSVFLRDPMWLVIAVALATVAGYPRSRQLAAEGGSARVLALSPDSTVPGGSVRRC